jgi:hypothetical protein
MKHTLFLLLLAALPAFRAPQGPAPAFARGEYLRYRIHYGFINAGGASVEVAAEPAWEGGARCFLVRGEGHTNSAFDLFFKVRDRYESYIDEQTLLSRRFNRDIREGSFESYTETWFDPGRRKAIYLDEQKQRTEYDAPEGIQDVISALYFARSRHDARALRPGDRISLRNFLDRKTFDLEAVVLGRETFPFQGQDLPVLKFELLIDDVGIITDGGRIFFWMTEDENKIPLRIECELRFGSLAADLEECRGLKYPFR